MPDELLSCKGNLGLESVSTKTSVTMALLEERECSQNIVFSDTRAYEFEVPVTITRQNSRNLAVGTMKANDLVSVSYIPSLNFSQTLRVYADETNTAITSLPAVPVKWQRPLDNGRENNIANYFWNKPVGAIGAYSPNRNALIPGAIILGHRSLPDANNEVSIFENSAVGNTFYKIKISYELLDTCATCTMSAADPLYPDPAKPFFSQCPRHGCASHSLSVCPLQIIDGQHRSNGILTNNPEDGLPVVFLLDDQEPRDPDQDGWQHMSWTGIPQDLQAEVFERVNNGAKKLDQYHAHWIKRILSIGRLTPTQQAAFDLFSLTGGARAGSPWRDKVQFHDKKNAQPMIDSIQLNKIANNLIGSTTTGLNRYAATTSRELQIENLLSAAIASANLATYFGGVGVRPFAQASFMERILSTYDCLAQHANACGGHTMANFTTMWDLHAVNWFGKVLNWNKFRKGSEPPFSLFAKVWHAMWEPSPAATFGSIDVNHNYVDGGGTAQTILWGDLVAERPLDTRSNLVAVPGNPHQLELTLELPFNCYPSVHIRYEVTQGGIPLAVIDEYKETIRTPSFVKNFNFTMTGIDPLVSATIVPGDSVQIYITYENHVGSTQKRLVHTF
jgi:hypothetical protein